MDSTTHIPVGQLARARRRKARGLGAAVALSLVLHAAGVAGAMWSGRDHKPPPLMSSIPVQLVKLGKERDPKLLPRIEAPAPPPPEEAVPLDTGQEPKPESQKEKQKEKSKEPELSPAAKRMLENTKLDRALSKLEDPEGRPDGDEMGTTTDATNAAQGYAREITKALQSAYKLPEAIPASQRQFLKARVVLFIEKNGRIASYEFVEKHPNALFMGALETLLKSVTLPPPPASQAALMREGGVEVIFRP